MTDKNVYKYECKNSNVIVIDSEVYNATNYIFIDDHIVIDGGKCGALSIAKSNLKEFIAELVEISKCQHVFTERKKKKALSTTAMVKESK